MAEEWQDIKKVNLGSSKDEWQPLGNADLKEEPTGRSVPGKVMQYLNAFTGGVNEGLSDVAGLPVDVANAALNLFGAGTKEPVMGSKFIKSKIMPEQGTSPNDLFGNILKSTGEQIPSMIPGAGVLGKGGQTIFQGLKGMAKVAGGAGVASGVSRTVAPNNPYMDMSAQLLGGLFPSGIKGLIKALSPKLEVNMMERAMKPSTTLAESERLKRLNTALDEGLPVTKTGVVKSKGTINEINQEIQQKIDQLSQAGVIVDRDKALSQAVKFKNTEIPKQAFPEGPRDQIEGVIGQFEQHPRDLTLRQAQDFKQSINKDLDDFYKALQYSPDKTAALSKQWSNKTKAKIADGLRQEISDIFPEVKDLNQREGSLIQLNKSLERAVNRISQHDIWSLKGVVSMVFHPKYAVMNYLLNNPTVQSKLAIAIRQARSKPLNLPGIVGETSKQLGTFSRESE